MAVVFGYIKILDNKHPLAAIGSKTEKHYICAHWARNSPKCK